MATPQPYPDFSAEWIGEAISDKSVKEDGSVKRDESDGKGESVKKDMRGFALKYLVYNEAVSDYASVATGKAAIRTAFEGFVDEWIQKTHEIVANLHPEGVKEPEKCDIDPMTGELIDPIEYPPTKKLVNEPQAVGMNSELRIQRAMRLLAIENKLGSRADSNIRKVRMPCHIRPAVAGDMEQVMQMYNDEAATKHTLPDKEVTSIQRFRALFEQFVVEKLPFFVAVRGLKSGNTDGDLIIGFALVDVQLRGLIGSRQTLGSACGKITVVVEPVFRRHNIGSALLDAIMTCCAPWYPTRLGYLIVNPDRDERHWGAEHNPRKWDYIDIETFVPSAAPGEDVKEDKAYGWVSTYLTNFFQMELAHRDERLYKDSAKGVWLDRLTFRRQCRVPIE
ncbi:hypothetical protein GGS23DRAFT_595212 [Durotheca rogersii]|uniref:uncharacterized protein n=1 Tax=Durotheca rogersii TaxID=419775 RepID=UPI002220AA9E|nr:uncharacterized protein GGS23DRAFT_595212 [Durotheca rogersii]KAI5864479.1 hypothetical protein GGS23DRAFT_595212 [Durotheca rogersii]